MILALHPRTPQSPSPGPVEAPPPADGRTGPTRPHRAGDPTILVRFVTHGLLAVLDCHHAGGLSPHRLAWELSARIEQLAELDLQARTLTRLRWLSRTVQMHTTTGSEPISAPPGTHPGGLTATLAELRGVIDRLLVSEG